MAARSSRAVTASSCSATPASFASTLACSAAAADAAEAASSAARAAAAFAFSAAVTSVGATAGGSVIGRRHTGHGSPTTTSAASAWARWVVRWRCRAAAASAAPALARTRRSPASRAASVAAATAAVALGRQSPEALDLEVVASRRLELGPRRLRRQGRFRVADGGVGRLLRHRGRGARRHRQRHGAGHALDPVGHDDTAQEGDGVARRRRRIVGGACRLPQAIELRGGGVDLVAQPAEVGDPSLGGRERLLGGELELGELTLGDGGAVGTEALPLAGRLGDPLVEAEVEQAHEEVLAVAGLGVQEAGELALRQRDARRELAEVEAEQAR